MRDVYLARMCQNPYSICRFRFSRKKSRGNGCQGNLSAWKSAWKKKKKKAHGFSPTRGRDMRWLLERRRSVLVSNRIRRGCGSHATTTGIHLFSGISWRETTRGCCARHEAACLSPYYLPSRLPRPRWTQSGDPQSATGSRTACTPRKCAWIVHFSPRAVVSSSSRRLIFLFFFLIVQFAIHVFDDYRGRDSSSCHVYRAHVRQVELRMCEYDCVYVRIDRRRRWAGNNDRLNALRYTDGCALWGTISSSKLVSRFSKCQVFKRRVQWVTCESHWQFRCDRFK